MILLYFAYQGVSNNINSAETNLWWNLFLPYNENGLVTEHEWYCSVISNRQFSIQINDNDIIKTIKDFFSHTGRLTYLNKDPKLNSFFMEASSHPKAVAAANNIFRLNNNLNYAFHVKRYQNITTINYNRLMKEYVEKNKEIENEILENSKYLTYFVYSKLSDQSTYNLEKLFEIKIKESIRNSFHENLLYFTNQLPLSENKCTVFISTYKEYISLSSTLIRESASFRIDSIKLISLFSQIFEHNTHDSQNNELSDIFKIIRNKANDNIPFEIKYNILIDNNHCKTLYWNKEYIYFFPVKNETDKIVLLVKHNSLQNFFPLLNGLF